jgi:acyl-CoA thioester hydrolase
MTEAPLPLQIDLSATVTFAVPFHDADPAGVAWHGNYFRYFDAARCALLDRIGYGYRQMLDGGVLWPIVQAEVKYVRPVPFDTLITVSARLIEWDYRLKIGYEIADAEGRRTTTGHTVQVAVDATTGEMHIGAPEVLQRRLRAYLRGQGWAP